MEGGDAPVRTTRPRARHWLMLAALLLLALATIVPPLVNIGRYQRRIAEGISRSLGRPVHLSEVKLHLLPRPGFEITNLVVDEDPAYGAEPILHANSVTASVRLSSLWGGRLEIARIAFDEASLNLVRNRTGDWNFSSILVQAAHIPNAPTGQRHPGSTPRFPYIEATNARVNFKFGDRKMPFSFLNADLSVWLDNPDEWQVRFEAQPVRTDIELNPSDAGLLRVTGSLRRAPMLRDMPLKLRAEWTDAAIGQLSRLLMGEDAGWRGDLDVRADISGSPEDTRVKTHIRADNLHRIEFEPQQNFRLEGDCQARLLRSVERLEDLACLSPLGDGHLLLTGSVSGIPAAPRPVLALELANLPAAPFLDAVRLVRSGFAPNVQASGILNGRFTWNAREAATPLAGSATIRALSLAAPGLTQPLVIPELTLNAGSQPAPATPHRGRSAASLVLASARTPHLPFSVRVEPVALFSADPKPLLLSAQLGQSGWGIHLGGEAAVERLLALSRTFGLMPAQLSALAPQGSAEVDLAVTGPWIPPLSEDGSAPLGPAVEGSVRLRETQLAADFLASPVEIVFAQGLFTRGQATWDPVQIVYGKLRADAALRQPLHCSAASPCQRSFNLRFSALDAGTLEAGLLGGDRPDRPLSGLLSRFEAHPGPWPAASGTVTASTFTLGPLALHDASAAVAVEGNSLTLKSLDARALGGSLHAGGAMDASGDRPAYKLEIHLVHANPVEAAGLFHERWGGGTLDASTSLELAGFSTDQLASSAHGTFHWDWTRGGLAVDPGSLPRLAPLAHFDRWTAEGTIEGSSLRVGQSTLRRGTSSRPVTGQIGFDRTLRLTGAAPGDGSGDDLDIAGTLDRPKLAETPAAGLARASRFR